MTNSKSHTKMQGEEEHKSSTANPLKTGSDANTVYKGYLPFEHDSEAYEKILSEICPQVHTLAA